jgi:Tfp pilus tip-associated adhesin PilY1
LALGHLAMSLKTFFVVTNEGMLPAFITDRCAAKHSIMPKAAFTSL